MKVLNVFMNKILKNPRSFFQVTLVAEQQFIQSDLFNCYSSKMFVGFFYESVKELFTTGFLTFYLFNPRYNNDDTNHTIIFFFGCSINSLLIR